MKLEHMPVKEVIRRILNSYLQGDDTFIHCCQTFFLMKRYHDCFADFGLTMDEVMDLVDRKIGVRNGFKDTR